MDLEILKHTWEPMADITFLVINRTPKLNYLSSRLLISTNVYINADFARLMPPESPPQEYGSWFTWIVTQSHSVFTFFFSLNPVLKREGKTRDPFFISYWGPSLCLSISRSMESICARMHLPPGECMILVRLRCARMWLKRQNIFIKKLFQTLPRSSNQANSLRNIAHLCDPLLPVSLFEEFNMYENNVLT